MRHERFCQLVGNARRGRKAATPADAVPAVCTCFVTGKQLSLFPTPAPSFAIGQRVVTDAQNGVQLVGEVEVILPPDRVRIIKQRFRSETLLCVEINVECLRLYDSTVEVQE